MHNIFDEHKPIKYVDNRMKNKGQNGKNAYTDMYFKSLYMGTRGYQLLVWSNYLIRNTKSAINTTCKWVTLSHA